MHLYSKQCPFMEILFRQKNRKEEKKKDKINIWKKKCCIFYSTALKERKNAVCRLCVRVCVLCLKNITSSLIFFSFFVRYLKKKKQKTLNIKCNLNDWRGRKLQLTLTCLFALQYFFFLSSQSNAIVSYPVSCFYVLCFFLVFFLLCLHRWADDGSPIEIIFS